MIDLEKIKSYLIAEIDSLQTLINSNPSDEDLWKGYKGLQSKLVDALTEVDEPEDELLYKLNPKKKKWV